MKNVVCGRCGKAFKPDKRTIKKYNNDGLCGKCRSRIKYLENVDKYRKVKSCPLCRKLILKCSKYCNSCSQLGNRNHQWKEITQNARIYWSAEWRKWREEVLERDNYICQLCGETEGRLHAHHILPKRDYPELIYNVDNGITLCQDCHTAIHFKEEDYADYFIDLIGRSKIAELSRNLPMGQPEPKVEVNTQSGATTS